LVTIIGELRVLIFSGITSHYQEPELVLVDLTHYVLYISKILTTS